MNDCSNYYSVYTSYFSKILRNTKLANPILDRDPFPDNKNQGTDRPKPFSYLNIVNLERIKEKFVLFPLKLFLKYILF